MQLSLRNALLKSCSLLFIVSSLACSNAYADPADLKNTKSGTNFLSGGIGREEVVAMRLVAKQYPLQILLSEGVHGTALTDVALSISDNQGAVVFKIQRAGPLLYVKLPTGDYKVSGLYNGLKQAQKVSVPADGKSVKLYLNWPGQPGDEIAEE